MPDKEIQEAESEATLPEEHRLETAAFRGNPAEVDAVEKDLEARETGQDQSGGPDVKADPALNPPEEPAHAEAPKAKTARKSAAKAHAAKTKAQAKKAQAKAKK